VSSLLLPSASSADSSTTRTCKSQPRQARRVAAPRLVASSSRQHICSSTSTPSACALRLPSIITTTAK
jgi:hypothetical protein